MIHLEVAVAAPLYSTLTYILDTDELISGNNIRKITGCRVLIPLSRRIVTGYILGRIPVKKVDYKLRKIKEILDDFPLFHENAIPFFRWVADYYQYPLGEVITTALPAGLKRSSKKIIRLNEKDKLLNDRRTIDLETVPKWFFELSDKQRLSPAATNKILSDKKNKTLLKSFIANGLIAIESEISKADTQPKLEVCYTSQLSIDFTDVNVTDVSREDLICLKGRLENHLESELKFSEIKAFYYFSLLSTKICSAVPQREILKLYRGGSKPLKQLCELGVLEKTKKRIYRNPFGETLSYHPKPKSLTVEQKNIFNELKNTFQTNSYKAYLLHGVTGSGKTEVYLRGAELCIENGKDVLILVPEIALATQLEAHFVSRFGELVALLHSGLSKGEKLDQWTLAARGKAKIVIGARSAVFAPLANIGLIVVDEEHDSGFKQDDNLRYNGRDMAILRAKQLNCTVILGSATPSITSYHHALSGKYHLLTMESRVGEAVLPKVKIIDLRGRTKGGKTSVFHQQFIDELELNLNNREQSLVLINRRGFSASFLCQDCGTAVQCKHCKVTLTYHKKKKELVCHYCGYTVSSQLICSTCHSQKLVPLGFGTERIEEELGSRFPDAIIRRLDSDTASDRKKFLSILTSMRKREIDILIGTQMIAKGHHFPHVTFVGVVWADGGLNMPDFRAAERTYQLLTQVTGRAGRGSRKGRVIIQTMRPHHYSIALAKDQKYEQFYQKEIDIRLRPTFPPFVRLVCFKVTGTGEYNVRKTAENLANSCKALRDERKYELEILGPASSPLEKIKDQYRWQVLLKSPKTRVLQYVGQQILGMMKTIVVGQTQITFDIDPENMM